MRREEELVNKLTNNRYTITVAESCTGGLLAGTIVNVSGSSEVFHCGFVTYANEAKEKYAHVRPDTLEKFGAVSEETAAEMAEGCAEEARADVGLSTTGIAGPGGGTADKPVGLVYIGVATPDGVEAYKMNLSRGYQAQRGFIREHAALHAFYKALMYLKTCE